MRADPEFTAELPVEAWFKAGELALDADDLAIDLGAPSGAPPSPSSTPLAAGAVQGGGGGGGGEPAPGAPPTAGEEAESELRGVLDELRRRDASHLAAIAVAKANPELFPPFEEAP